MTSYIITSGVFWEMPVYYTQKTFKQTKRFCEKTGKELEPLTTRTGGGVPYIRLSGDRALSEFGITSEEEIERFSAENRPSDFNIEDELSNYLRGTALRAYTQFNSISDEGVRLFIAPASIQRVKNAEMPDLSYMDIDLSDARIAFEDARDALNDSGIIDVAGPKITSMVSVC